MSLRKQFEEIAKKLVNPSVADIVAAMHEAGALALEKAAEDHYKGYAYNLDTDRAYEKNESSSNCEEGECSCCYTTRHSYESLRSDAAVLRGY